MIAPGFAERVRNDKRSERFRRTADLPNRFRRPHGPGWALVGVAGDHKDPMLALGISDAFRDAELSSRQALADALAVSASRASLRDRRGLPASV